MYAIYPYWWVYPLYLLFEFAGFRAGCGFILERLSDWEDLSEEGDNG